MYHRGRRLYRHLRNRYISLPSAGTLRSFVKKAKLHPGINEAVMRALKKKTATMPEHENDVIAMFDEVSLKKTFTYLKHEDRVVGFADYGDGPLEQAAGHGFIFMAKSLFGEWKFPYSYVLTSGHEDAATIANFIIRSLTALMETGLRIRVLVMDLPSISTHCACWERLQKHRIFTSESRRFIQSSILLT